MVKHKLGYTIHIDNVRLLQIIFLSFATKKIFEKVFYFFQIYSVLQIIMIYIYHRIQIYRQCL